MEKGNLTESSGPDGLLKFQINRNLINLAKNMLFILEDVREYTIKLEGIIKEMNVPNLDVAANDFQVNRKRILQISNDSVRDLFSLVERLDIRLRE